MKHWQKRSLATAVVVLIAVGAAGTRTFASTGAQKEKAGRGWLGVAIQDVNKKIAKKYKLSVELGAFVIDVVDDSPADSAGVREHDVIVEFGGRRIDEADALTHEVDRKSPGTKTTLVVLRDGEKRTLNVTVGRMKTRHFSVMRAFPPMVPRFRMSFGTNYLGLRLVTLNEQLGEYFGAPNNEGVLVEEVEKDSPAEKGGFNAGDVVVRIGKKSVEAVEDIARELEKYDAGDKVEFEVLRKGSKQTLSVELDHRDDDDSSWNYFDGSGARSLRFCVPRLDDVDLHMERLEPEMNHLRIQLDRMKHDMMNQQRDIQERFHQTVVRAMATRI